MSTSFRFEKLLKDRLGEEAGPERQEVPAPEDYFTAADGDHPSNAHRHRSSSVSPSGS